MICDKNKVKLYIETDLVEDDSHAEIDYGKNSNKFRFKTYINGTAEIPNLQDFIIRLSVVTSLFIITCPHFLMDYYFSNTNTNDIANIYLRVSIYEQVILSGGAYYFIMTEDLDGIYDTSNNKNMVHNLRTISDLEKLWAKYYSVLGIIVVSYFYFINSYCLNSTYIYILCFSIFRLSMLRYLKNKNLIQ